MDGFSNEILNDLGQTREEQDLLSKKMDAKGKAAIIAAAKMVANAMLGTVEIQAEINSFRMKAAALEAQLAEKEANESSVLTSIHNDYSIDVDEQSLLSCASVGKLDE